MPDIEFPTSAGPTHGYLATPAGEQGPAVIVLQEWWGIEEHIRSVCDRLAAEGFYALAPDLYGGETTTQPSEAEQKMMALSMDKVEPQMCGAAEHLAVAAAASRATASARSASASAAAWRCGPRRPARTITAAVTYYYVMPHGKPDFSAVKGPVLGHFGTADEFIKHDEAKALESELRDAGVDVTFHYYEDAGHAFFNDTDRLGTHDPAAATVSWERTVSFLRDALAPGS